MQANHAVLALSGTIRDQNISLVRRETVRFVWLQYCVREIVVFVVVFSASTPTGTSSITAEIPNEESTTCWWLLYQSPHMAEKNASSVLSLCALSNSLGTNPALQLASSVVRSGVMADAGCDK
jgi:hypothetical protein